MGIIAFLIPISVFMGGIGLVGFFWMLRKGQFDDPQGDANRILQTDYDDQPKE